MNIAWVFINGWATPLSRDTCINGCNCLLTSILNTTFFLHNVCLKTRTRVQLVPRDRISVSNDFILSFNIRSANVN